MSPIETAIAHYGLAGVHEAAALLPFMAPDELEELIVDVIAHGWRDPIIKTQDDLLLDGRNRLVASMDPRMNGHKLVFTTVDVTDLEAVDIVLGRNLHRRQLKSEQKAMVILDSRGLVERLEREAKERQAATAKANFSTTPVVETIPQPNPNAGRTNTKLAALAGIHERLMGAAKSASQDPELAEAMRQGKLNALKAEQEMKKRRAAAKPEAQWSVEEAAAKAALIAGETVVVNIKTMPHLVAWADKEGLYQRVDRKTDWGNPFETPKDGDRETVIRNYAEHYLPFKPSLDPAKLAGLALGCWCAPLPCHGDVLKGEADA